MLDRRTLLKRLSALPLLGGLAGSSLASCTAPAVVRRNLFAELGVRTFINGAGTLTYMTGSLMHDEVLEAIMASSKNFCMLDELQDKVGAKIAELTHAEAAVVTSGAFSAMTLALAGILTGPDPERVKLLPHIEGTGMKSEVICQKGHDIVYTQALTNTGCKMVFVETVEELEQAINERTALMWFLHIQSDKGRIMHEEWVALGKKHGIPTAIDIAADVPPVENLWKFNDMGFDFVAISGGKAMRGPQSAGLLMGKKDIVAAARMHMPPRGFNIGRGMKVNKEEILGMYVALEKFINTDHDAVWKQWEAGIAEVRDAVGDLEGIATEVTVHPLGNVTPRLEISWDPAIISVKGQEVQENLRKGEPSIELAGSSDKSIALTVWMMKPGEPAIVAGRIREELTRSAGG
jgi:uncharacterized pyridoxal phosphate-dependent enzyme